MPADDWTHQMQLRIDGVWSISNRNWNKRSFLFPATEEGEILRTVDKQYLVCVCLMYVFVIKYTDVCC